MSRLKSISFNTKVTVYAQAYVTLMDIFYLIAAFHSMTIPSDAWYIGHIAFWGVELGLNYGIYKDKKRVHMSADGSIQAENEF